MAEEIIGTWESEPEFLSSMSLAGWVIAREVREGRLPPLDALQPFLQLGELTAGLVEDVEEGSLPEFTGISIPDSWLEDGEGKRVEYPIRLICDTIIKIIEPVQSRPTDESGPGV